MKPKHIVVIILLVLSIVLISAEEYLVTVKENSNQKAFAKLSLQSKEPIIPQEKIIRKFSTFNGYVVNLSKEEAQELKKNPSFNIQENQKFYKALDVSVPQINVNDTWILLQNQTNITGSKQTVCVIDSGVDYTHTNLGGCYGNNDPNSNCTILGGWDFVNNDALPLDDEGHGTHVTGIITSNHSTYKGVAPNVKIVALKALDNTGGGYAGNITSAIDWCVSNASTFNISVITMSIGTVNTFRNTYCDSSLSAMASAIHAANAANITVIASSGNCEISPGVTNNTLCPTGIAAPGCISGVIPVGTVNAADAISYQRGALFQVLAPGVSIDSTANSGGITALSGTSMSAPHVAGLAALLTQFNVLQKNISLNNATVTNALNNTNTFVDDTSNSGYIFPRVDALQSLYFLDTINPNVTLISPTNASSDELTSYNFTANITDFTVQNITFYLWKENTLINQSNQTINSQSYQFKINISDLEKGTYYWTVSAQDKNSNVITAQNFTNTVYGVETENPTNNTFSNTSNTNFTCSAQTSPDLEIANITFNLYNSTTIINTTTTAKSGTTNTSTINYTFTNETHYFWNCTMIDNNSQTYTSSEFRFTYDETPPTLNLSSNIPTSQTASSTQKIVYFNVSDNNNQTTCSLQFNNITQQSKTITNYSIEHNFTVTVTPNTYNWKINCSDQAGNQNTSQTNSFTIAAQANNNGGGGSGGGGGGGSAGGASNSGTKENPIAKESVQEGYKTRFTLQKQVYFTLPNNENHSITLNKINNKTIHLTIQSEPINITVTENETKKINLSSQQTLDIQITVNSIQTRYADITIKAINEQNPTFKEKINESETMFYAMSSTTNTSNQTIPNKTTTKNNKALLVIAFVLIMLLIVAYLKTKKHIKQESIRDPFKKNKDKEKNDEKTKKTKTKKKRTR